MGKLLLSILTVTLVAGLALPMATPSAARAEPVTTDLVAGQILSVGQVHVWNDAAWLYVYFETWGDWWLEETHLAVADSFDDIPKTKSGNPKVGHFIKGPNIAVQNYTYEIPLDDWKAGTNLFLAAHAVVFNTGSPYGGVGLEETAWACGESFGGRSWATYFNYMVQAPSP